MQRKLTATEITDILFQKPDRITAGILDKRTRFQRLPDIFQRPRKQRERANYTPNFYDDFKLPLPARLRLTFEQAASAPAIPEQDNSFINARKELKALGLSYKQIAFIFDRLEDYTDEVFDHNRAYRQQHNGWMNDDRVFLGKIAFDRHNIENYSVCFSPNDPLTSKYYDGMLEFFTRETTLNAEAYRYQTSRPAAPKPK